MLCRVRQPFVVAGFLFVCTALCACNNEFSEHYRPTGLIGPKTSRVVLVTVSENEQDKARVHLLSFGYELLGESSFEAVGYGADQSDAAEQGKSVGADLILFSKRSLGKYTHDILIDYPLTRSENDQSIVHPPNGTRSMLGSPLTDIPGGRRQVISTTVERFEYCAQYWVMPVQVKLGLVFDPGRRHGDRHEETAGIRVLHVVKGSPAFLAGVREGDEIVSVGRSDTRTTADCEAALRTLSDGNVRVEIVRDGERIEKNISVKSSHVDVRVTCELLKHCFSAPNKQ